MFRLRKRPISPPPVLVAPVRLSRMRPPLESDSILQPLREIGLLEKTQPWSNEDIHSALRLAYLRGIDPEKLYGTATQLKA